MINLIIDKMRRRSCSVQLEMMRHCTELKREA